MRGVSQTEGPWVLGRHDPVLRGPAVRSQPRLAGDLQISVARLFDDDGPPVLVIVQCAFVRLMDASSKTSGVRFIAQVIATATDLPVAQKACRELRDAPVDEAFEAISWP